MVVAQDPVISGWRVLGLVAAVAICIRSVTAHAAPVSEAASLTFQRSEMKRGAEAEFLTPAGLVHQRRRALAARTGQQVVTEFVEISARFRRSALVSAPIVTSRSTSIGTPVSQAIPDSASTSSGSLEVNSLTLAPPAALATCQPPPRCPQPCGMATVPATMSSVSVAGSAILPNGERTATSSPSAIPRFAASSMCISGPRPAVAAHQQRSVVHPRVLRAGITHADQPQRITPPDRHDWPAGRSLCRSHCAATGFGRPDMRRRSRRRRCGSDRPPPARAGIRRPGR